MRARLHVRFPEPSLVWELLGPPNGPVATDEAAHRLALQKMASRGGLGGSTRRPRLDLTALVTPRSRWEPQ